MIRSAPGGPALLAPLALLALLAAPARAQGQPDYQRGDFRLERSAGERVVAELVGGVEAPELQALEWILYAARAPRHALSEPSRQFMWRERDGKREPAALVTSPSGHPLFQVRGQAAPSEAHAVRYRVRYEVQLYTVRLVPGPPQTRVLALSDAERKAALGRDETFMLDDTSFQAWLDKTGLRRRPQERDLAFGYRVLQAIQAGFRYAFPPPSPTRRCPEVARDGASDCGGLSALAAAALRANGIPARLLVGRWAQTNKDEDPQYHVKYEFFADGIGWVPCDGSGAVTWQGGASSAFGRLGGPFLCLHVGDRLAVETVHWGRKPLHYLQGVAWWVRGTGKLEPRTEQSQWVVRPAR